MGILFNDPILSSCPELNRSISGQPWPVFLRNNRFYKGLAPKGSQNRGPAGRILSPDPGTRRPAGFQIGTFCSILFNCTYTFFLVLYFPHRPPVVWTKRVDRKWNNSDCAVPFLVACGFHNSTCCSHLSESLVYKGILRFPENYVNSKCAPAKIWWGHVPQPQNH